MITFDWEAIKGIIKRELVKYFRAKGQIVSTLIMPIIFMLFLRPGLSGGDEWMGNYLGAGIICMVFIMSGIMMTGMPIMFDKMMGFEDIYAVAPVKRRNLVLGFLLAGALKSCFMAALVVLVGLLPNPTGLYPNDWGLGWPGSLLSIIPLAVTIFFGGLVFGCIGLIIAAKTDMTNTFLWNNLINMPLVFISGAIIPIGNFGVVEAKYALLCNPTTWMADAIRVFLGTGIDGTGVGPDGTAFLFFGGNLLLGYLLDIAVVGLFGILLFYLAFRIFGGSLTESSGGFSGTIQKKSAEIREKMFKDLDPEDRQVMMKVTGKINMLQMGQIMGYAGDGRQDLAIKMLKEAGISDEDISKFFAAGMHMMQKMQKQAKK